MSLGHICTNSINDGYCECFYEQAELITFPEWQDTHGRRHAIEAMPFTHIINCIKFLLEQPPFYEWCELSTSEWLNVFDRELQHRQIC